jgi:hypothetical protein
MNEDIISLILPQGFVTGGRHYPGFPGRALRKSCRYDVPAHWPHTGTERPMSIDRALSSWALMASQSSRSPTSKVTS